MLNLSSEAWLRSVGPAQAYMEAFERGYLLERACAMRSLEERLRPQTARSAATLATHLRKVEAEAAAVPVVMAVGGRVGERHVRRLFGGRKKLSQQLQEALRDATTQVCDDSCWCNMVLVYGASTSLCALLDVCHTW